MSKPVLSIGFDVPFTDAIAWAKNRVSVLPDIYYNDLPGQARSRAFTVSGLSAIDQIQGVLDSMHRATESGETFAQWKKNLKPEVLALGNARLDNIFRTGIQTHYNIGRYEQQEANKAHRPYRMWDAINDGRTRPAHKAMDNFIAPIDDPIWRKWSAPAGFRCRCSTISLTEAQAKQRGYKVGNQPPVGAEPDKGWDYDKRTGQDAKLEQIKAQRLAKVDADIRAAAEKALQKPIFVSADDYIKAGRQITKDFPDAVAEPEKCFDALIALLEKEVGISTKCKVASSGEGAKLAQSASQRFPDSWTKKTDGLGDFYTKAKVKTRGHCYTANESHLLGKKVKLTDFGVVDYKQGDGYMVVRKGDVGNAVHEYSHRLQNGLPELDALFQEMHRSRTANDPLEKLADIHKGAGYDRSEVTRKDKYISAYQGKEYGSRGALEVMTMAFEDILGFGSGPNPAWKTHRENMFKKVYTDDRDMFDFVVGVLRHWNP